MTPQEIQNPPAAPAANRASGAALGFLIVAVIFAFAAVWVKVALRPPAVDADRAAERSKALAEIHATEEKDLATVGWIDQKRGIVRLPIDKAMQLAAHEWQNPAAARADLKTREQKATAELPKAPAKPNPFE
ncbi:MAG TPA: hypothetical protein VFF11_02760 [Candidatus Binatia bacterium]|nr:hypothetical protein [Candidatus Binatia bacterium]